MAWRFSDAPDQIGKEVGENLATGDYAASNPDWSYADGVWSRDGGGTLVLADGDPFAAYTFEPDATYTLAAEVLADNEATIGWGMSLESNGEQVVIGDAGVDVGETVPGGEWVTASKEWRSPDGGAVGSVAFYASAPGVVQVRNVSVAEQTGRVILTVPGDVLAETIMASGGIIAGTPGGARVELTEDGLHAFDAAGVETANIQGEGGEFVGGSFRTSDNLPGQVEIRDDGYVDSTGLAYPGIRVTPSFEHNPDRPPGIGPNENGLIVTGGTDTAGRRAYISATPTNANIQSTRADGTRFTLGSHYDEVSMRRVNAGGVETAAIWASDTNIGMVRGVPGDGANFGFQINASGVWVSQYGQGGASYNLLETAQDSGWQSFPVRSGITANDVGWRNKGGVCHFKGTVSASWTSGWNTIVSGLPAAMTPASDMVRSGASSSTSLILRMSASGTLDVNFPAAYTGSIHLSPLSYVLD